jgi:heme-degrading monooxygenase HmoA
MVQMAPVASFHLIQERSGALGAVRSFSRLGWERWPLSRVPGLVLWRLLGTGRGSDTGRSIQPERRAAFLVWRDASDLDAFIESSSPMASWRGAPESWHVRLEGAGGHGKWRGLDVPAFMSVANSSESGAGVSVHEGPVAVLTRAEVKARSWRRFASVGDPVSRQVAEADGLLRVVAIGEAPIGRQATFSLWESLDAVRTFAYGEGVHREVVARTHREGWYGEEMFARFVPTASAGGWGGEDPLRGRVAPWW